MSSISNDNKDQFPSHLRDVTFVRLRLTRKIVKSNTWNRIDENIEIDFKHRMRNKIQGKMKHCRWIMDYNQKIYFQSRFLVFLCIVVYFEAIHFTRLRLKIRVRLGNLMKFVSYKNHHFLKIGQKMYQSWRRVS